MLCVAVPLLAETLALRVWPMMPANVAGDDAYAYLYLANRLAHGESFALWYTAGPTGLWAPGYPWWLSLFIRLFGYGHVAIAAANAVLYAAGLALVWAIGSRMGGVRAAAAATVLYGFLPSGIERSLVPLSENLFDPLALAVVCLCVRRDGSRLADWVLAAVLLAAGSLTRPAGILLCIAPLLLWRPEVTVRRTAAAAAVGLACLAPWLVRNARAPGVGASFITTESGFNLLAGNNPNANGGWSGVNLALPAGLPEARYGSLYTHAAVGWIVTHPMRFAALIPLKVMNAFDADTEMLEYWDQIGQKKNPFGGAYNWIVMVTDQYYALLLGAGLLGIALYERGRLGLPFALVCAPIVVYFGMPRFHDPVMGLVCLGAGRLLAVRCPASAYGDPGGVA